MNQEKKQRGRPKKTENTNNFQVESNSDDDLKEFMKKDDVNTDLDKQLLDTIQDFENIDNDIPNDDFTPLSEPVTQRSYTNSTSNINNNQNGQPYNPQVVYSQDKIIEEPVYTNIGHTKTPDVDDSLLNPSAIYQEEPKTKPKNSENDSSKNQSNQKQNISKPVTHNDIPTDDEPKKSPKEIRDDAEKTADIILSAYQVGVPKILGGLSKYNINKLQKLHKEDKIDIETPLFRDGSNFIDYATSFNSQADEIFKVTPEEVENIRTPLIDVLVEKQAAMTPMQRLMTAVGVSFGIKAISAVQLAIQKNKDIKDLMQVHQERREDEIARQQLMRESMRNNSNQQTYQQPVTTQNSEERVQNVKVVDLNENNIQNNNSPSLDDALNADFQTKEDFDDNEVRTDFTEVEEENDIPE